MNNPASSSGRFEPDTILIRGNIHTMDPHVPRAEALAIWGGRVMAVGSNAEIRSMAGTRTQVVDAEGRFVMPGFNDAHVHFLMGGFQLANVDLGGTSTPNEMVARLQAFAARLPAGRWITGGGWDHEAWPGTPLPTRHMIDAATPHVPVLVSRLDCHMALANRVALDLAGITAKTPAPAGGEIVKDPRTDEPTGLLRDAAMNLVSRHVPTPSFADKLEAARAASAYAASLGVTSVTDMSAGRDVAVYLALQEQGGLQTRIHAATPLSAWERLEAVGMRGTVGDGLVRIGCLKAFSDGSLGSTTALFFEPYNDAPSTCGLPADEMFPEGAMLDRIRSADRAGLQVMIHAIGDRANDLVLSLYETVIRENGPRDRRFRIEHAQHLREADIPRFAQNQIIASVQPYHLADDGRWAEKRIGAARCQTTYAFRSLLDQGAMLAFGSDWTVAPLNPFTGVKAAVTRQTLDGLHPQGWVPAQRISLSETLQAYTVGSAFAEFAESRKGRLVPGQEADFVMLDRDPFGVPPEELDQVRVVLTALGGRTVFSAA